MNVGPEDDLPMCSDHPEEPAGWRCDAPACRKLLCGKCTAKTVNQHFCGLCGATATQLVVTRSSRPFTTWLGKALLYPLSYGILRLGIVAVLLAVIAFLISKMEPAAGQWAGLSWSIRGAIVIVYALAVADAAAHGNVAERGAIIRLGRGVVATLVVSLPAFVYLWFLGIPAKGLLADKLLWLYIPLALIYLPIAIATSMTDASYADASNPFKLFELAWHLGRRYLATAITAAILAFAAFGIANATADKIRHAVTAPIVSDLAASLPTLAAITAVAYLVGLLPYVVGDLFGWGDTSLYADALHPKLVAEARRKNAPAQDLDATQAAAAASALAERNDVRKVQDAIKEDQMLRALKLYEVRMTWNASSFDERALLLLGKAATRAKRNDLAKRILDEAIARNGRQAGHALVALAQLYSQMNDEAKATEVYRQIVEQYPNSEVSKVASLKLKA